MNKVMTSDALVEAMTTSSGGGSGGGGGRAGSGNMVCSTVGKKVVKSFFEFNLHVSLMQLIEVSNELCLVHACLNILIHMSAIE